MAKNENYGHMQKKYRITSLMRKAEGNINLYLGSIKIIFDDKFPLLFISCIDEIAVYDLERQEKIEFTNHHDALLNSMVDNLTYLSDDKKYTVSMTEEEIN